jgi:PAS domain S-box-containing protein
MDSDASSQVPEATDTAGMLKAYASLERQYKNLVSRSLAGVFRTTLDGRFLECNDAMAHMLGYSDRSELMALTAQDIYVSLEERERFLDTLARSRKLVNYEITLKHRNGRSLEVLENVFLDEDEDGQSTIQGTFIDITSYRQTELEQRALMDSYRNLVEHIRDGLLVVRQGRILYANPAAEEIAGAPLIDAPISSILHPADVSIMEKTLVKAQEGKGAGPAQVRSADGREWMLFVTTTYYQGEQAFQLTLQDQGEQRDLIQQRLRVQMAEEVNEVLRQEITEHRNTQEALRRSRQFARSLIDSSLDMIMASDTKGRITEYNPAAAMRFGWEQEEVMGGRSAIFYADVKDFHRVQRELDTHGMFAGEIQNITRSGEVFTSFLAASRLYDEDGIPLGVMGVSRDITRMKQDQEDLRASEERYRDLFENATDLIQSVDADGRFQYVNTAWRQTLGYTDAEVEHLVLADVVHPQHLEDFMARFKRIMDGKEVGPITTVFLASDGREVVLEGSTNLRKVEGKSVATRSIFRDITRVQQAKRQVLEHEAKLRALFESSEHMFWTVGPDIKLTSYNRGYSAMVDRLHGTEPEINTDPERPRKLFAEKEYHEFWEGKYREAFQGRPIRFETDRADRNGQRVCNEIFLSPVFGPDGTVQEVFGVGHEITEQKEAEDRVREQSARLRAIFESSANMMIWTLDRDLRITSCNDHFRRSVRSDLGVEIDVGNVFITRDAAKAAGKNNARYLSIYKAALKGKAQQFEAELHDQHGNTIWVQYFLNPIVVEGEVQELSCLAYHITDRKLDQMELLRSLHEKEVLLKEVHHRVKNNLQIISSIFSLQTAHVGEDPRIQDLLRDSRDRIRSMAFIHESIYQTKDLDSVDLEEYIEGLGRNLMLSYSLTGKIELVTELAPVSLPLDQAIPCGLILNELISNALKHAFPKGREGIIHIRLGEEEGRISIALKDNGVGVPEGFDRQRDGNLGLELVHTLVEQLDGTISMDTTQGVSYLLTFERIK